MRQSMALRTVHSKLGSDASAWPTTADLTSDLNRPVHSEAGSGGSGRPRTGGLTNDLNRPFQRPARGFWGRVAHGSESPSPAARNLGSGPAPSFSADHRSFQVWRARSLNSPTKSQ